MPALTVVGGPDAIGADRLEALHEPSLFDERYQFRSHVPGDHLVSAHYPEYPFTEIDVPGSEDIFVEGVVYNRSPSVLHDEILSHLVGGFDAEAIGDWLSRLDGEFVFYVLDEPNGTISAIPDGLGQLPLWYGERDGMGAIGRNLMSLVRVLDVSEIDRLAAAQYLRLGYSLSNRTLYEGVHRVPPGQYASIDLDSGGIECHEFRRWDLEVEISDQSLDEHAAHLADLFTRACERRASSAPGDIVVLLSGGLDSRSVVGGLERKGIQYATATRDFRHDPRADVHVAEALATAVEAPWIRFETPAPEGSDLNAHLEMGGGIDPFEIAHIQSFLRAVNASFESPWTLTGDGGDKLLPDLTPPGSLETLDELVDAVLSTEGRFTPDDVEAVTGISKRMVRASIRDRIETYPEKTPERQFLHYQIFERGFAWLFPATDTNRNHCWTTTPFYANGFLEAAIACSLSHKRRHRLFHAFLRELSPVLNDVTDANVGVAPSGYTHGLRYTVHRELQRFPWLLTQVMPIVQHVLGTSRDAEVSEAMGRLITAQLSNGLHGIRTPIISRLLEDEFGGLSRRDVLLLATLVSVIGRLEGKQCIEEFDEVTFS